MKQSKIEKNTIFIITVSLITIYIADGLSKFLIQLPIDHSTFTLPNRYVKVLLVLVSIGCSYFLFKSIPEKISKIYLLLVSLLIINLLNWFLYDLSFEYFLKYSCFFFFAPMFLFNNQNELWIKYVERIFKYLVYINIFFIILGILFDVKLFQTYYLRLGYNGLLLTSMQSTYFYISAILIAINRKDMVFFTISVISSLVIGTKILLFFLLCIGIYMILTNLKNEKSKRIMSFILVVIFLISLYFLFNQGTFLSIIDTDGILSAIFSYRNDAIVSVWHNLSQLDYNLITGGINLFEHRVEMDLVDIILHFGTLGVIIFIIFFIILKRHFVINKLTIFCFTSVLFFIIIAGNFLYYPINCFLFLITLKSLSINTNTLDNY